MSDLHERRATPLRNTSEATPFYSFIQRIPMIRAFFSGRRSCAFDCDAQPANGSPIFVVVHGTWAPGAGWTRQDSRLLLELTQKWPTAGIYRFKWSGVNGALPRIVASDVLSEHLTELASVYPFSNIVAIAHSHGGNAVAWASTQLARPIAAAVYLNTPFIQVLKQTSESHVILQIVMFICLLPTLVVFVGTAVSSLLFPRQWEDSAVAFLTGFGVGLSLLCLLLVKVPPSIDTIRERLTCVSSSYRKVARELVVFVVGDEPSAALGAVYFAQWLGRKAIIWLIVAAIAFIGISVVLPRFISDSKADQIGSWLIGSVVAILVLGFLLAMSAYGMVHGLVALDSSVTITPAPIGEVDFATVCWTNNDRLRHSVIYESPEAISTIINWLEDVLASART